MAYQPQVWCITHSDLDGMASAAVVKQSFPNAAVIITNYGRPVPMNRIKPGETVFVTDFSLNKASFDLLRGKNCRIIWIDHHENTYKEIEAQGWNCEGIRRADYCGAALTWMYLHPGQSPEAMPRVIKLVNEYDLWTKRDPDTDPFAYGSGLWDIRPAMKQGDQFWNTIFSNADGEKFLGLVIKYGREIQQYIQKFQDCVCKDLAYYTTLPMNDGPKNVIAMACRTGNSSVFERMDTKNVDAVFTGQYSARDGRYKCSFYSPDAKKVVLDFALKFGGGGHPTACGFSYHQYPLRLPEVHDPRALEEAIADYEEVIRIRNSSPVLIKHTYRGNGISARAFGWNTHFAGFSALAFNHYYLPDMLPVVSTNTECIDPDTGEVAQVYLGFVMTNCGWYRCCAYPTSTSTPVGDILAKVQETVPQSAKPKVINGGVWWYSKAMPVTPPIKTVIDSSSAN